MVFTFQPPFWAGLSGYVAEMGSAFLCAALGIVPTVRHADYLASWLEVLREDNRAIFKAASQASKAAEWLLSRHAEWKTANAGAGRENDGGKDTTPSDPAPDSLMIAGRLAA